MWATIVPDSFPCFRIQNDNGRQPLTQALRVIIRKKQLHRPPRFLFSFFVLHMEKLWKTCYTSGVTFTTYFRWCTAHPEKSLSWKLKCITEDSANQTSAEGSNCCCVGSKCTNNLISAIKKNKKNLETQSVSIKCFYGRLGYLQSLKCDWRANMNDDINKETQAAVALRDWFCQRPLTTRLLDMEQKVNKTTGVWLPTLGPKAKENCLF